MKKAIALSLLLTFFAASSAQAVSFVPVFARVFPAFEPCLGVVVIDHYNDAGELMFRAITQYYDDDGSGDLSAGDTIRRRWAIPGRLILARQQ